MSVSPLRLENLDISAYYTHGYLKIPGNLIRGTYLWRGEVAEPRVSTLDGSLLNNPIARLPVAHIVRSQAVLPVQQAAAPKP